MSKLLALDLDGTLMYPKRITHCIPRKNAKFLKRWVEAGNRLVLITSRSKDFLTRLKKEITVPFDFINCTSSQIIIDGEIARDETMNREDLKKIVDFISKEYHPVAFLGTTDKYNCIIRDDKGTSWFMKTIYKLYNFFQFSLKEEYVFDTEGFNNELDSGDFYKIMVFFGLRKNRAKLSKEINKVLRENFPQIESSWSYIVNELTPLNCNKGVGLEFYCQKLNIEPDDVYVVGDSGNDIAMFNRYKKNSYCMRHAYPSVKKYAAHVISRVHKLDKLVLKGDLTINKSSKN